MDWIISSLFDADFIEFLSAWSEKVLWILVAFLCWAPIVVNLLLPNRRGVRHATVGSNGPSCDCGCGDSRVHRLFVIFGGSAGLSFGIPHFLILRFLGDLVSFGGKAFWISNYWSGFIYLQFILSLIQSAILMVYMLIAPREKWIRFLKAHLKGCGWITALSPVLWPLYWLQKMLNDKQKWTMIMLRDIETTFVFAVSFFNKPLWAICAAGTVINSISSRKLSVLFPILLWIDEDHVDDEDSSGL